MLKQAFSFSKAVTFIFLFTSMLYAVPWLGVSFNKQVYPDKIELLVRGVHPSSDAISAGLQAGDIIDKIDGKIIKDNQTLKSLLKGKKVGDKVQISFRREGKSKKVALKMTERPDDISSLMGSAIGSRALDFGKNFYANVEKRNSKPKATLLDFWATWCGPCRNTLPMLDKLYKMHKANGLEIIGVSSETTDVLKKFYQQFPAPYPLYQDIGQKMWSHYNIRSVPTLILLDENGYILKVWHGVRSEKALQEAVKTSLGINK